MCPRQIGPLCGDRTWSAVTGSDCTIKKKTKIYVTIPLPRMPRSGAAATLPRTLCLATSVKRFSFFKKNNRSGLSLYSDDPDQNFFFFKAQNPGYKKNLCPMPRNSLPYNILLLILNTQWERGERERGRGRKHIACATAHKRDYCLSELKRSPRSDFDGNLHISIRS